MFPLTFETFDPSPYQRTPRLSVMRALALGRALLELRPESGSSQLDRIADKLERLVSEGEATLTTRRRESIPADHAIEITLDGAADALWTTLRNGLDHWSVFEHPGLVGMLQAHGRRSSTAVALAQARKKAERARELSGRLFGADGLAFLRLPYPEQALSMASILRLIEEDGLAPSIDALAGPEVMVALVACQVQYEAMVKTRMSRVGRKSAHLGQLRGKLQRAIARYTNAVLTLLDEDEPESLDVVLTALQPVEVLRARVSRGTSRSSGGAGDPRLEEDEAEEDEAEEDESEEDEAEEKDPAVVR
jgi:hypothetical protein